MAKRVPRTLTVADLPAGSKGTYQLTPAISKETHTHIRDVEKLIREKARELDEDLYSQIHINNQGALFTFGPVSELDLTEFEEVVEV